MATLDTDAIRSRAYEFWQADGEVQGRELDYWLKAEAEIKAMLQPATKPSRPAARRPAARTKAKA
jgi:hypothetical protein